MPATIDAPPQPAPQNSGPPTSTVLADIMAQVTDVQNQAANAVNGPQTPVPPPAKPPAPPKEQTAPAPPPKTEVLPDPTADTPAEPAAQDDDTPADLSESAKPHWKTLRQKASGYERELKAAQAELAKIKTSTTTPDQFVKEKESLLKERDDLLKRLQVAAIEKDPRFEAYFTNREKNFVEQAKRIAGEHGAKLAAIITMPESEAKTNALEEILTGLPVTAQARIGGIINNLETLHMEKQSELSRASETFKTMREQETARNQDFISKANGKMEEALSRWSDPQKGLAVFQTKEGDEAWNKEVESTKAMARQIFSGESTIEEKVRASMWAAAAPRLLGELKAEKQRATELEQQLSKLKGAQPSVTGKGAATSQADDVDENLPLHIRMTRMAQNSGAFMR